MPTLGICSTCGAELSIDVPEGLCSRCLLLSAVALQKKEGENSTEVLELPPQNVRYFGDYVLLGELARGGMGVVFKARQSTLNRLVALKMILPGILISETLIKRFLTEAEAAAQLDHPNIVPIYEVGEHEGQHFFSMRLIEGPTLASHQKTSVRNPRWNAALLAKVARAIHFAHQRGVLHRDLKPANILLDAQGEPYVVDFGIAKLLDQKSDLTRTQSILGTLSYMSPEQARGQTRQLTIASDIFSLGVILYELLTGTLPFRGEDSLVVLRQICEKELDPELLSRTSDHALANVCLKCLDKAPERRYATAAELADDLERWLRHEPVRATRATALERLQLWVRRKPALAALTSALVASFIIGFVVSTWQWRQQSVARKQAEAEQYRAKILLTETLLRDSTAQRAREVLLSAPREHRNWEWGYLMRQTFPVIRSFTNSSRAGIITAAFSTDASKVLTADRNGLISVWDVYSSQRVAEFKSANPPAFLALNSARQELVSVDETGAYVWNVASKTLKHQVTISGEYDNLDLTADGSRFVISASGKVAVWNLQTGAPITPSEPFPFCSGGVNLNYDGRVLAVEVPGGCAVLETESGKLLGKISLPGFPVQLAPDGKTLLGRNAQGLIVQFHVETGTVTAVAPFASRHERLTSLPTFTPDGTRVVRVTEDWQITTWTYPSLAPLDSLPRLGTPLSIHAISPDSRLVIGGPTIVGDRDSVVDIFSIEFHRRRIPENEQILTIFAANSGNSDVRCVTSQPPFPNATILDLKTGAVQATLNGHFNYIASASFSLDGERVVTSSYDNSARIWNAESGALTIALKGHTGAVGDAVFSPSGDLVATTSVDGTCRLWDAKTGSFIKTIWQHSRMLGNAEFSPSGALLAVGSSDGSVKAFDMKTGAAAFSRKEKTTPITHAAFSPDERALAVGFLDRTVELWDLTSRKLLTTVSTHDRLGGIAFNHDGRRLFAVSASASGFRGDGSSRFEMWDVPSGAQVLSGVRIPPNAHALSKSSFPERLFVGGIGGIQILEPLPINFAKEPAIAGEEERILSAIKKENDKWLTGPAHAQTIVPEGEPYRHPRSEWPQRPHHAPPSCIDLTEHYNILLNVPWEPVGSLLHPQNDLRELPLGIMKLQDISFDVRGGVQPASSLGYRTAYETPNHRIFPVEVSGIAINRKCSKLFFLHASQNTGAQIVTAATFVLHYADGSIAELPVIAGKHVADWWSLPGFRTDASDAVEVWKGSNPAIRNRAGSEGYVRLFLSERANPRPDAELVSVDLSSSETPAAYFLIALSVE